MALSFSARAFKEVPKDIRDWSRWIREELTQAVTGTLDLTLIEPIATNTLLGRATAGTGVVETITCTSAGRALIDDAAASDQRTTLGLGTSAVVDTGTSGTKVPLLDGVNTWADVQTLSKPPVVPSYTVVGVPSASPAGQLAYISNEAGGAVLAFSDATNWRRVTDRAIIS